MDRFFERLDIFDGVRIGKKNTRPCLLGNLRSRQDDRPCKIAVHFAHVRLSRRARYFLSGQEHDSSVIFSVGLDCENLPQKTNPGPLQKNRACSILIGMYCSKLTPVILLVWLCLSGTGVSPAWSGENNDAISAKLSESHQRFLVRVVRRTVRDRILNREPYVPAYIPDGLRKVNVEVIVRLRERGYLRAAAAAGPMPIVQSTLDAAKRAADSLVLEQQADVDVVDRLLVEIEMIGAAEPFAIDGDWTLPGALDPWIEPGIHGLVLTGPNIQQRFTPTELFTSDLVLEEALDRVVKLSHARPVDLRDVKLMRFQTQHWIQYTKRDNPVSLQRGLVVIPPQAVTS